MAKIGFIGVIVTLGLAGNLWAISKPWVPMIEVGAKTISVAPAKMHLSPFNAQLEIKEAEGCEAKVQSSKMIQFSDSCEFLRGIYHYSVRADGTENPYEVYSEFMLHQVNAKSRAVLINSPVVVLSGS